MLKSLTLFMGKLFFKSPVVHHISPKVVNVAFSNSKTNSPVVLNLKNVASIKFGVNLVKGANTPDEYSLVAMIDNSYQVELGVFESKKEADEALLLLNIQVSSLAKFFAKWIISIFVFVIVLMMAKDFITVLTHGSGNRANTIESIYPAKKKEAPSKVETPVNPAAMGLPAAQVPAAPGAPVLTDAELMDLFNQAQKLTAQQNPTVYQDNQSSLNDQPQVPKSQADAFLDQLK